MTDRDLAETVPPAGLSPPLRALWWDTRGSWEEAHRAIADEDGRDAAWVHAYLHRKESDLGNARYWYARAGRTPASGSLDEERETLFRALSASPAVD